MTKSRTVAMSLWLKFCGNESNIRLTVMCLNQSLACWRVILGNLYEILDVHIGHFGTSTACFRTRAPRGTAGGRKWC